MRHALLVIHFQDRAADAARDPSDWLARLTQAMDAAARDDVPIVVIRQVSEIGAPPALGQRDPQWGIHPEIAGRHRDILIDLCGQDIFSHPGLVSWLAKNSIDAITLCGYLAAGCDDVAARRARQFGYVVHVLTDATKTSARRAVAIDLHATEPVATNVVGDAPSGNKMTTTDWVERLGLWRRAVYLSSACH